MATNKPRLVKDYDKLSPAIQEQIKLTHPYGFAKHLITYRDAKGKLVSALPFETDEYYYLVRMTKAEALEIIMQDSDYTDRGMLKERVKEKYSDKYSSLDYINIDDDDDDDDDDDLDDDLDEDSDEPQVVPYEED